VAHSRLVGHILSKGSESGWAVSCTVRPNGRLKREASRYLLFGEGLKARTDNITDRKGI
jgi:hypothetical protein